MTLRKRLAATAVFFSLLTTPAIVSAHAQSIGPNPADMRQGSTFSVNGADVFYQESGQGPDLLLIHGFPLSGQLFANQTADLAAQFHVIVVDLPGFGRSTANTAQQTDATYASDLFALLNHLQVSKAVIGGHSMGGQIALEMYRENPGMVAGLILYDTNPAAASIIEQHEWPGYSAQARALGPSSLAPSVVPIMVTGHALMTEPNYNKQLTHMVGAASPEGVSGGVNALVTRPDFTAILSSIGVPTLVVVGQDDPLYAYPISQALKNAIPGAEILVVPNAGHASMYQRPRVVDPAILSWATGHGLTR